MVTPVEVTGVNDSIFKNATKNEPPAAHANIFAAARRIRSDGVRAVRHALAPIPVDGLGHPLPGSVTPALAPTYFRSEIDGGPHTVHPAHTHVVDLVQTLAGLGHEPDQRPVAGDLATAHLAVAEDEFGFEV